MTRWITILLASMVPAVNLFAAPDSDCPATCNAVPNETSAGTPPAGVSYGVILGMPIDGSGTTICATCTPCSVPAIITFNGYDTGWCVTIDLGGGPSQPLPRYSRPGALKALCDGAFCVQFTIVNCQTGGGGVFQDLVCLYCGCLQ